tara:strand:- start:1161 stop:1880 length:720 start_codon:yes stop_codon:yes gene_type:complete
MQGLFAQNNPVNSNNIDSLQKTITIKIDSSLIEKKTFDAAKIDEYKNSEDFNYVTPEVEPSFFQKVWDWIKKIFRNILEYFFDDINPITGFLLVILRILPYIILAVALFFMIKYFLNIRATSILKGSNKSIVTFGSDEELIKREDLETLLKDAIDSEEYRIAVRFYYLLILKKLTASNLIVWQQEKTNEDYIKEIKETSLQSKFSESTRVYDFVWYGNFNINKTDFINAELIFKSILNK